MANPSIVGNPKCGAFLKGKNPTNLVNNVRKKHVGAFKEYLIKKAEKDKEDEAKKKKTSPSTVSDVSKSNSMVQPTLSEVSAYCKTQFFYCTIMLYPNDLFSCPGLRRNTPPTTQKKFT